MKLQSVECYAGYKGEERPMRFQLGERKHVVVEILDRWYGPDDDYFRVRADDGNLYVLRRNMKQGWTLESFRTAGAGP